jgi:hypothetical protein
VRKTEIRLRGFRSRRILKAGAFSARGRRFQRPRPPPYGENGTRSDSIAEALPDSESQSITAPSIRTSP